MTTFDLSLDTPGGRLLLIELAAVERHTNPYRHLYARVVRQAWPNVIGADGVVVRYYDGATVDNIANGYRWADYSSVKSSAIEVRNLMVFAQLDVRSDGWNGGRLMREGQPYVNEVRVSGHNRMERREIKRAHDALLRLERAENRLYGKGYTFADTYADACRKFALALGIKKILAYKNGREGADLSDASAFAEFGLDRIETHVDYLVDKAHGRA